MEKSDKQNDKPDRIKTQLDSSEAEIEQRTRTIQKE